jgi:hypothetical protein
MRHNNNIPVEILLEIFDAYRQLYKLQPYYEKEWNSRDGWFKLAHVCLLWRCLVFSSSSHLHVHLLFTPSWSSSGKPWFFFSCFKCFFYLPQVKKAHSVKSTQYFSQDIPFTFYTFSVLFSTFLLFFLGNIPKNCTFLYFFVLFEQIYFKNVKYFFEQLQNLKKK